MRSPHRPLGFTLIEVVVVVLIVGIMLGAMTFYIGGQDSSLVEEESERLAVLARGGDPGPADDPVGRPGPSPRAWPGGARFDAFFG